MEKIIPTCHPERAHHSGGLCATCAQRTRRAHVGEPELAAEAPLAAAQRRKVSAAQAAAHAGGRNALRVAEAAAARKVRQAAVAKAAEALRAAERRIVLRQAKAATPFGAQPPPRGRRAHPDLVVGLAAAGVSQSKIAQVLHVNRSNVEKALDRAPGSRERIAQLREELKGIKIARAHAVEGRLWDRLDKEVGEKGADGKWTMAGAAKDVDAITRALLASEKIQAAAAGEAHASGAGAEPPSPLDLTVLVQALLSAPGGG